MSADDYQMKMREAAAREMIRRQVLETYPSLAVPDDPPEERFRIERFKSCCAMPFAERIAQLEAENAKLRGEGTSSIVGRAFHRGVVATLEAERAELLAALREIHEIMEEAMHPDAADTEIDLSDLIGTASRAIAKATGEA